MQTFALWLTGIRLPLATFAPPSSLNAVSRQRVLWASAVLIFVLELLILPSILVGYPGPSRYFASLWAISYDHSISRRILLGTLLRALHLDNGNYLLISVLGWPITVALFVMVAAAVRHLVHPLEDRTGMAWMVILLLSPVTTGVLVVTTGDPVQIGLLGLFALMLTVIRPGRNLGIAALCTFALGVLSILIHEATLFFLAPVLLVQAFGMRRAPVDRAALAGYLAGALPTLVLVSFFTERGAAVTVAPLHFLSHPIRSGLPIPMPSFSQLLADENNTRFHHGLTGLAKFLRSSLSASWLPVFFTYLLGYVLPLRRRFWVAGAALLVLNLPLWVIAYDFGRFTTYLFCSLLVMSSQALEHPGGNLLLLSRRGPIRELDPALMGTLLLLTGLTNSHTLPIYIMRGLGNDNVTLVVTILVSLVALLLLFRSQQVATAAPDG